MALSNERLGLLACPACRSRLIKAEGELTCSEETCGKRYPLFGRVPILLNEERSLFRIDAVLRQAAFQRSPSATRFLLRKVLPSLSLNLRGRDNYKALRSLLVRRTPCPVILLVGAGEGGAGLAELFKEPQFECIHTDIYVGPNIDAVADAHDLPLPDASVDAVILQAVLEHVADPCRCAGEAVRVLKPGGFLYSEIPFMQQVHMEAHDFTRFTLTGHRLLFRELCELRAGVVCGPAMALSWSVHYLLRSLSTNRVYRKGLALGLPFLLFWLKYADLFLGRRPGAVEAASGTYFLGSKAGSRTDEETILRLWRNQLT